MMASAFETEPAEPVQQVSSLIAIIRIVAVLGMGLCISFGLFISLVGVSGMIVGIPILLLSIPMFFLMQFAENWAQRHDTPTIGDITLDLLCAYPRLYTRCVSELTPIRRQYLDVKRRYPHAIVFFRLGDFYETFDDDAELCARELEITLTSKPMGKGLRVPLAGIPYHAVDGYLAQAHRQGLQGRALRADERSRRRRRASSSGRSCAS